MNRLNRSVPFIFSILSIIALFLLPKIDGFYSGAFLIIWILNSLVFLSYLFLNFKTKSRINSRVVVFLAVIGCFSSWMIIIQESFGSVEAAAGDIGGIFLLLMSLLVTLGITVKILLSSNDKKKKSGRSTL